MSSGELRGSASYIWNTSDTLGNGATGAVYVCRHKKTGDKYAVKTFNSMSHQRPIGVQMREFELLRKLDHKNVVSLLAVEEETYTRSKVIIMELCNGSSVFNMLDDPENAFGFEENEFLTVVRDVANGIGYLKSLNIVHRDIKPGNIMRYIGDDKRSVYKLIDFGAARELQEEEQFNSLYGTEEYLHPEMYERAVLRGPLRKQFGASVDLWSLGVTFYHVAAGQLPFRPYGGRRNKETMHRITTTKESGVISGVQHSEGGRIEWSRELPKTCRLSQGLKDLITPVFAGLVECKPDRMWTFEKFFHEIECIVEKKVLTVFSVPSVSLLKIYVDRNESLSKVQDLIAGQTDLAADQQLLVYDNTLLSQAISPMQAAENYPPTSAERPIIIYPQNAPDFTKLTPLEIPKIPKITPTLNIDEDHRLAKMCCGTAYLITRAIKNYLNVQATITSAVKMFISVMMEDILHIRNYVVHHQLVCEETLKRSRSFTEKHAWQMQTLDLFARGGADVNQYRTDLNRLLVQVKPKTFLESLDGMKDMHKCIDEYYEKLIVGRELNEKWKDGIGCTDDDRCLPKSEKLSESIREKWVAFKKNRLQRKLSYNEEQISKFEKIKMNDFIVKSQSLVLDHCFPALQRLYRSFIEWFGFAIKIKSRLKKLELEVKGRIDSHALLIKELDQVESMYTLTYSKAMVNLGAVSAAISSVTPLPQSGSPATSRSSKGTRTSARDRELMREISNDLQLLERDTAEVRDAVAENTSLIMKMREFSMQNGHAEQANGETATTEKPEIY